MSLLSLLTQKCTIQRKSVTKNEYSHTVVTWEDIKINVSCRIDYMNFTSTSFKSTPSGLDSISDYVGYFAPDEDIQKGDRIIWGGLSLYARPPFPVYRASNFVHHYEVPLGLQEN